MNLTEVATQLLFTTVPIWAESESGTSSATAFIYNYPIPGGGDRSIPFIVTNYHVVAGAKRAVIELVQRDGDKPALGKRVRVQIDAHGLAQHKDERLDIAAVPLGPAINQLAADGREVFFRSISPDLVPSKTVLSDLGALEEVVFIGYPSGLRDQANALPLIRKGITSTPAWNDFDGKPCFLVDAGVFPGSSGSPVFILNQGTYLSGRTVTVGSRVLFLGILTSAIMRSEKTGGVYLGLGSVTRSDAVHAFLARVAAPMIAASPKAAG